MTIPATQGPNLEAPISNADLVEILDVPCTPKVEQLDQPAAADVICIDSSDEGDPVPACSQEVIIVACKESRTPWPAASSSSSRSSSCGICLLEVTLDGCLLLDCGHAYCRGCLVQHFNSSDPAAVLHRERNLPHCPSCKAEGRPGLVSQAHLDFLLRAGDWDETHYNRLLRLVARQTVDAELYGCIGCGAQITLEPQPNLRPGANPFEVKCPVCKAHQCCRCAIPWKEHKGQTCAAVAAGRAPVDEATRGLLEEIPPCPGGCGQGLDKERGGPAGEACNVLHCSRCGVFVCALCGDKIGAGVAMAGPERAKAYLHFQGEAGPCGGQLFTLVEQWRKHKKQRRSAE